MIRHACLLGFCAVSYFRRVQSEPTAKNFAAVRQRMRRVALPRRKRWRQALLLRTSTYSSRSATVALNVGEALREDRERRAFGRSESNRSPVDSFLPILTNFAHGPFFVGGEWFCSRLKPPSGRRGRRGPWWARSTESPGFLPSVAPEAVRIHTNYRRPIPPLRIHMEVGARAASNDSGLGE